MVKYSSESIESKDEMDALRFRPTFGVGARDVSGQIHAVGEIFTNSKDEMPYVQNGTIQITMFVNRETNTYQIAVSDNGRGVPLPSLVDVFMKPHTSGKYNQMAYKISGGLFGIGAKATLAVTKRFKVITARDSQYGVAPMDQGYGSITTSGLELVEHSEELDAPANTHGTLVVFEFDDTVMVNLNDFIEYGYQKVIENMQRLHFFNSDVHFSMYIVDTYLPEEFWISNIYKALEIYHNTINKGQCIYDSNEWTDPYKYLNLIWNLPNNLAWESGVLTKPLTEQDILGYDISIYLPKRITGSGIIALVNDIYIVRSDSYHIQGFISVLKEFIGSFIEDSAIRTFFFDKYKLPIYVAMNIKYSGAEFVGTTKDSFRDADFLKLFTAELKNTIEQNKDNFTALALMLQDHILTEYNRVFNKAVEVKSELKLMFRLNNPTAYFDCEEYGPNSELYIVEGNSASGVQTERDVRYQALVATRGKPYNGVISLEAFNTNRQLMIQRIIKDKIWQDLIAITGIEPGNDNQDLSTLRFGKIVIMHDADPDGSHIEATYISNFYILNPNIVTSGILWVAKPPLFLLQKKQNNKYKFFMFNESAIIDYHILLYTRIYDIFLREKISKKLIRLENKEFRSFCYEVLHIGELITDTAKRINIPDFIFECLLHCLNWLDKDRLGGVATRQLRRTLPFDKVLYNESAHALTISNGFDDHIISLNGFLDEVYTNIYPRLQSIRWDLYDIVISSKLTNELQEETCSFIKTYKLFKLVDEMFDAKRFKGLGTMRPTDLASTCIVPDTRALFHIESLEDVKVLFEMMGTDTTARREMLEAQDLLV